MVRGFTLIELLVVIAIIAILAGTGLAVGNVLREKSRRNTTTALCRAVVLAVASYRSGPLQDAGSAAYRAWDWNLDQVIDGRPSDDPDFTTALRDAASTAGYMGLAGNTGMELPGWARDQATGRIKDAWGRWLHIAWAVQAYEGENLGVWSTGRNPDRADDDLTSWSQR